MVRDIWFDAIVFSAIVGGALCLIIWLIISCVS